MDTRSISKIPLTNIEYAMSGFYILEELELLYKRTLPRTLADPRFHKFQWSSDPDAPRGMIRPEWLATREIRLEEREWGRQVHIVREAYIETLAAMIFDYLVLIAFGEARHGPTCIGVGIPELTAGGSRSKVIQSALEFSPYHALVELRALFAEYKWGNAYGGKAWARICDAALLYYDTRPVVFIDHVADLSHNGSICFDKLVIFELQSAYDYKQMLDRKRDGSLLEGTHIYAPIPIARLLLSAPKSVQDSLPSWPKLRSRIVETFELYYTPIQFGRRKLSAAIKMGDDECNKLVNIKRCITYNPDCACVNCKWFKAYGKAKGVKWRSVCTCTYCILGHIEPSSLEFKQPFDDAWWWVNTHGSLRVTTPNGIWKPDEECTCNACRYYRNYGSPFTGLGPHSVVGHSMEPLPAEIDTTGKIELPPHIQTPWGVWKPKKTCKCPLCNYYKSQKKCPRTKIYRSYVKGHKWGWQKGKTLDGGSLDSTAPTAQKELTFWDIGKAKMFKEPYGDSPITLMKGLKWPK